MENIEFVLQVRDLRKSFKVGNQLISVIKGMSFDVKRGAFTVIIGASGSGKSTLLHMLLGLEIPSSGTVTCLNTDLYKLPNEDARSSFRKKYVGMVYQQPNWIKSLNVVENVAFPLSLLGFDKGEAIKKAWHVILKMGMSNWVNYYPTELSGGQQQKIALARALVTDPEIIIADEPTGNLDFESGKALMQLLRELNESGKTVLMVTHDLEYVKYGQYVIKIFDGKIASISEGNQDFLQSEGLQSKRGEEIDKHYFDNVRNNAQVVATPFGNMFSKSEQVSEDTVTLDIATIPDSKHILDDIDNFAALGKEPLSRLYKGQVSLSSSLLGQNKAKKLKTKKTVSKSKSKSETTSNNFKKAKQVTTKDPTPKETDASSTKEKGKHKFTKKKGKK